jgi:hypothetical protein
MINSIYQGLILDYPDALRPAGNDLFPYRQAKSGQVSAGRWQRCGSKDEALKWYQGHSQQFSPSARKQNPLIGGILI